VAGDSSGPLADALDRAIRRHRPACAFLLPAITSPEGLTTRPARLAELATVLDRHRLPVVEDNMLAELHHTQRRPATFANRCRSTEVLSVEAPSEIVWGGLRVGWVRAEPGRADAIARRIALTDLGVGVAGQLLAERVLAALPALLPARRRQLAGRSRHLRRLLGRHLPAWVLTVPVGGLSLWVRVPVADTAAFAAHAAGHGVEVMPGSLATVGRGRSDHIRLCLDRPEPILDEAVTRLAAAWRTYGA
jgi:DNA-binding transcriptional MocR family regulator